MKVTFPVTQNRNNTQQVNFQRFINSVHGTAFVIPMHDEKVMAKIAREAASLEEEFGQKSVEKGWDICLKPSCSVDSWANKLTPFRVDIEDVSGGFRGILTAPLSIEKFYDDARAHIVRFLDK